MMRAMQSTRHWPRRHVLGTLAAGAGFGLAAPLGAQVVPPLTKPIPKSGEALPVVGLGSWITFNVGNDRAGREASYQVLRAFFEEGGRLVDSSPMYGSSQPVIGEALARLGHPRALFSAEKVWTSDATRGPAQMEASRAFWGVPRLDLMQVHNLLAWEQHLPRLLEMKAAGRLRYVGISTSEGRRHAEFERILREQPLDFIQLSYNPADREAEQRLLPLAAERGVAVIVNMPFGGGGLLRGLLNHPLPPWAADIGCTSWAQVLLKFVLSHPAVTCTIPGTRRREHMADNVRAGLGPMPEPGFWRDKVLPA